MRGSDRFGIGLMLVLIFGVAFLTTTILTDVWCHVNGFYDEGRAASAEVGQ